MNYPNVTAEALARREDEMDTVEFWYCVEEIVERVDLGVVSAHDGITRLSQLIETFYRTNGEAQ